MPSRVRTIPRKRPRQDRARATVEAILDATASVLVRSGYDRTTTNRIAEQAGVSIGSLYQYFPNKQALVAALIDRHCDTILSIVSRKFVELADAPLRRAAREMVDAMLEAHRVNPDLHKTLIEQVPAVGRMKRIRDLDRTIEVLVRAFLETKRGSLRRENLDLASFVFVRAVEALTHASVIDRPDQMGDELVEEITDLVVRYAFRDS
jgi:AcrR family transcriptional regulator